MSSDKNMAALRGYAGSAHPRQLKPHASYDEAL